MEQNQLSHVTGQAPARLNFELSPQNTSIYPLPPTGPQHPLISQAGQPSAGLPREGSGCRQGGRMPFLGLPGPPQLG